MFNMLILSRIHRLIKNDETLPVKCYSNLLYHCESTCTCFKYCIHSKEIKSIKELDNSD